MLAYNMELSPYLRAGCGFDHFVTPPPKKNRRVQLSKAFLCFTSHLFYIWQAIAKNSVKVKALEDERDSVLKEFGNWLHPSVPIRLVQVLRLEGCSTVNFVRL